MQISYILTLKSDLDVDTISIILAKGGVADSYSLMTFGTEMYPCHRLRVTKILSANTLGHPVAEKRWRNSILSNIHFLVF